ncbi:DUF3343 domain-containing protein, partial [Ruminococcus sp.]
ILYSREILKNKIYKVVNNMKKAVFVFGTLTYTQRGREALRRRGILTKIIRTPVQYRNGSCGYSLLVINRVDESVEILRAMNIPVQGVYPADLE